MDADGTQITDIARDEPKGAAPEEDPKAEYDASLQKRLQVINVVAFVVCMIITFSADKITGTTLGQMGREYGRTPKIAVAGWALGIWVLIYILIITLIVYQALPNKNAESRNNELIYRQIKYVLAVNLILNGLWLVLTRINSSFGLAISTLDIIFMDVTCIYMMMKSTRAKLDMFQIIVMRVMFTLYAGWVNAATIINITNFLASVGMKDPSAGLNESTWAVIILYVALAIYIVAAFMERNPLFGALYLYVLIAIRAKQTAYPDIQSNSLIAMIILIVALIGITGLSVHEKMNGKATKGLFY